MVLNSEQSIALSQWLLIPVLTGWTIAFAPPYSKIRPTLIAIAIALACLFQLQVHQAFSSTPARGPLAAICWVNVLNAIDLIMLSRVSYDAQIAWEMKCGQGRTVKSNTSQWKRFVWSVGLTFNYRRVNTPWQIRAVPAFDKDKPGYVPDRWAFLRNCVINVGGSLLVLHFFAVEADDPHLEKLISELSGSRMVLLPAREKWTARGLIIQTLFMVSFGCLFRAAILGMYNFLAMICVILRVHQPVDWPPIFGSTADMHSLTRVWGIAWHQMFRKPITSNVDFLLFSILRVPRGPLSKTLRLIITFFTSGIIHLLMDLGFDVSTDKSGALWFFCLHIPGIILEDLVKFTCHGMIKQVNPRWRLLIGYVWVSLFFLWSAPVWLNPIILRLYQGGQRLPSPFLMFKSSWIFS
jgi:hypothetical protein